MKPSSELELYANEWLSQFGLSPSSDGWSIAFTLSTVPMEHWFHKRNRLTAEAVKLELTVPSWGLWIAQLERHDKLYQAQWRSGDDLRVESQQLKYRRLINWPRLTELEEFPKLALSIEEALGISFIQHVNVGARFIDIAPAISEGGNIKKWLSPCATTVGEIMK